MTEREIEMSIAEVEARIDALQWGLSIMTDTAMDLAQKCGEQGISGKSGTMLFGAVRDQIQEEDARLWQEREQLKAKLSELQWKDIAASRR